MTQILQEAVSDFSGSLNLVSFQPVGGGSINDCFALKTNREWLFAKVNDGHHFPGMFEAECQGLQMLKRKTAFLVPKPLHVCHNKGHSVLIMEHIKAGIASAKYWKKFGQCLAEMHRVSGSLCGLGRDNYIGSLPQNNDEKHDWKSFFLHCRIRPQLAMAKRAGLLTKVDETQLLALCDRADQFFPSESPALLHGDLWSGNAMCGPSDQPAIFDPAVYFGHRYMDLGMTKLFGGFDQRMYQTYHEIYPLDNDWEAGAEVANLYPLLVHVNLFGRSYVSQVRAILKRYSPC